jgi:hypothetical protein
MCFGLKTLWVFYLETVLFGNGLFRLLASANKTFLKQFPYVNVVI